MVIRYMCVCVMNRIYKLHFLNRITEIIKLFHDILIYDQHLYTSETLC